MGQRLRRHLDACQKGRILQDPLRSHKIVRSSQIHHMSMRGPGMVWLSYSWRILFFIFYQILGILPRLPNL